MDFSVPDNNDSLLAAIPMAGLLDSTATADLRSVIESAMSLAIMCSIPSPRVAIASDLDEKSRGRSSTRGLDAADRRLRSASCERRPKPFFPPSRVAGLSGFPGGQCLDV